MNRHLLVFMFFLLLSTAWNCGGGNEDAVQVLEDIKVTPDKLDMVVGEVKQLKAVPVPTNVPGISFSWNSENKDVVTVSGTGVATAIAAGTTNITAASGGITKKIPVTVSSESSKINIGNSAYEIDTLEYVQVAKGITWFKFNLPEFVNGFGTLGKGLVVHSLEVDVSSKASNRLEVCPASPATWGNLERPSSMFTRKQTELASSEYRPIAAINGDFFLLSGNNSTGYAYINNRPLGMEITQGMVVQTPYNSSRTAGFVIRENGAPDYHEQLSFSGQVYANEESFPLAEVNGFAKQGELVLFNNLANSYPTDSAFAWSPYTSTMVSLSYPDGGWRINEKMEFTVTAIDYEVETTIPAATPYKGKDFNGEGAILVGNKSTGNDSQ